MIFEEPKLRLIFKNLKFQLKNKCIYLQEPVTEYTRLPHLKLNFPLRLLELKILEIKRFIIT